VDDHNGGTDTSAVTLTLGGPNHSPVITSVPESVTVLKDFSLLVPPELVQDGGFESGLSPPWTVVKQPSDTAAATGAAHSGGIGEDFQTSGDDVVQLSQAISTLAGVPYTVSFWVSLSSFNQSNFINVLWNGATVLALPDVPATGSFTSFRQYTVTVMGTG